MSATHAADDAHGLLQTTLADIQKRFEAENDITELEGQMRVNEELMAGCVGRRTLRRRNRLRCLNEDLAAEMRRRRRKREVYEFLTSDLEHALHMADAAYRQQQRQQRLVRQSMQAAGRRDSMPDPDTREAARERQRKRAADAALIFRDVVLVDDGHTMQHTRAMVDDVCPNCSTLMHRNTLTSCLVCPNLECQFMREYIDTSNYSSHTYTMRDASSNKSSSNVTHYSAFLNTCQGRTSRKLSTEFLFKICYFLRAEGVTSVDQINKKKINRAQKYFLPKNEYNISVIIGTRLRGDALRIPPEVIKKMHLLFRALWPIFNRYKRILEPKRRNMANFDFISRVMVRLLGYDVLLPLFSEFDLEGNKVRHYAFVRRLFRHMGWEWCEQLSDVPDAVLDQYDDRHAEEIEQLLAQDEAWAAGGAAAVAAAAAADAEDEALPTDVPMEED